MHVAVSVPCKVLCDLPPVVTPPRERPRRILASAASSFVRQTPRAGRRLLSRHALGVKVHLAEIGITNAAASFAQVPRLDQRSNRRQPLFQSP